MTRRSEQIAHVFERAVEIDDTQRDAYLNAACGNDARLRAEVEQLLEADRSVRDDFLLPPLHAAARDEPVAGASVGGRYRLLEPIGQGAWGIVWRAQQERPVERVVAIKFLRWWAAAEGVLARFEAEKQSLARLDHPGIARVFDAGATPRGQPYVVMEYIDGTALHESADRARLGVRQRLLLLVSACQAVHHAHTRGVIHRDLKPTNMLVDQAGRLRIIDFGIARLFEAGDEAQPWPTRDGTILGTPEFMSPEQVRGSHDVDPRTDVHALGAVMHHLLTGLVPSPSGAAPQPASAMLAHQHTTDQTKAAAIAQQRDISVDGLVRMLRGDLDAVMARALEPDRDARYGSALELAADLERYLDKVPVHARRTSAFYRLRRWADRNRLLMVCGLLLAAVLIASTTLLSLSHARLIQSQRLASLRAHEAERQRAAAQAAQLFLQDMLSRAAAMSPNGMNVRMLDVLQEASAGLADGALHTEPHIRAAVQRIVGRAYMDLGLFTHAAPHLREATQHALATLEPGHSERLELLWALGECDKEMSRFQPAMQTFEQLHLEAMLAGQDQPWRAFAALNQIGNTLHRMNRSDEALPLLSEARAGLERTLGRTHIQTAVALFNEAAAMGATGRLEAGEARLREAIDVLAALQGPHDSLVRAMRTLASRFVRPQGRTDEAEQLLRDALETAQQTLGIEHQETNASRLFLGKFLHEHGAHEEARPLVAAHHEHRELHFPSPTLRTMMGMLLLAEIDLALHDAQTARATLDDMLGRIEAAPAWPDLDGSQRQWNTYRIEAHRAAARAAHILGDLEAARAHETAANAASAKP